MRLNFTYMKTYLLVLFIALAYSVSAQNNYVVSAKRECSENKKKIVYTKEQKFVVDNLPSFKLPEWKKGMRFMMRLDCFNLLHLYSGSDDLTKKTPFNCDGVDCRKYKNKIFTFIKNEDRPCFYGDLKGVSIFECDGDKLIYVHKFTFREAIAKGIDLKINGLVNLDNIDKARELLKNRYIYLTTGFGASIAYRESTTQIRGDLFDWEYNRDFNVKTADNMNKYMRVKIKDIGIGVEYNPIKIILLTEKGSEFFVYVRFSNEKSMCTTTGNNFSDAFKFTRPKTTKFKESKTYPSIKSLKRQGLLRIGMTDSECVDICGSPNDINTTIVGNIQSEQWCYDNNCYLYFKNGILESIQY